MKTREMINKDENTVNFANHFNTKQSIKNLLKKVPNAKKISPLFENPKYGKEILEYSNLNEQFDIILSDVFSIYTRQVADWRSTGDNRSTSARDEFFRDLVINRMKKAPGKEIAATLGDFMKSATGKEIEKTLADAGIKEGDDLYLNIIIWIAARTFINNVMVVTEVVGNVEQQVEHAAHSSSSPKKEEIIIIDTEEKTEESDKRNNLYQDLSPEVKKVLEMIDDMNSNVSDDQIRQFTCIIKPYIPNMLKTFRSFLDNNEKCKMTDIIWRSKTNQAIIKSFTPGRKFTDDEKKVLAFAYNEYNNSPAIAKSIFFVIIDILRHPSDDSHIYNNAKFLIRMLKAGVNNNAFLEEIIDQASRMTKIVNEIEDSEKRFSESMNKNTYNKGDKSIPNPLSVSSSLDHKPVKLNETKSFHIYDSKRSSFYNAVRDLAHTATEFALSVTSTTV